MVAIKYAILLIVLLVIPAIAKDLTSKEYRTQVEEAITEYLNPERFQLGNECASIGVTVEHFSRTEHAEQIGLDKEVIETTVKNILRGSQIYAEKKVPGLLVQVDVGDSNFYMGVFFVDIVDRQWWIEGEGLVPYATGPAATWFKAGLMPHLGDPYTVLHGITLFIERFVDEYLRVNAEACD